MPPIVNAMQSDISAPTLADEGRLRIEWADRQMPVLSSIRARFEKEHPLKGQRIAACLHVTSETANLMRTLHAGGAEVLLCASNPLSTQDSVAASLVRDFGIAVFARHGEDNTTYYAHVNTVLDSKPTMTMDDGGDLVSTLHKSRKEVLPHVKAGTEETTTGVIRFRAMEKEGVLRYPIIAINDAATKHFFDNRYGTGQSSIDGILRATNVLLAGKRFVVGGYGWCGRGVASRARGMGAQVIVTEVDPIRALEATMDGFSVMTMAQAAAVGEVFITATGNRNVIDREHLEVMPDGAIVCNTGHFNVEINIPALEKLSKGRKRTVRPSVEEYTLTDGRRIFLLGEGRLVNLAAAEGHPATVMDMSFANQALTAEYLAKKGGTLQAKVYDVPADIDKQVARIKLQTMGVTIDTLSGDQERYLASWQSGT